MHGCVVWRSLPGEISLVAKGGGEVSRQRSETDASFIPYTASVRCNDACVQAGGVIPMEAHVTHL